MREADPHAEAAATLGATLAHGTFLNAATARFPAVVLGAETARPPLSIWSPPGAEPEVQLSYRVDDIAAAAERVRAAGGHADEPERKPFGLTAECVDNQGATFRLWQPADRKP